ncbi:MAG: hypothetical protein L0229_06265 [Blastocatellia bacterium]|nr:hypothetical protein [Blastocatellia bacterium]
MTDSRPGLNIRRMVELMEAAISRCELDLRGMTVLTEAASGAYSVTPVLAAMAGARSVFALAVPSRYGTPEQVREQTLKLAETAKVAEGIEIVTAKTSAIVAQSDIITNSGHVRPIDAEMVGWMKSTAVVPLMYEAWEFRPGDVDIAACRQRGITVAGTNERHPAIDVFSFLGVMAVKQLMDAGVAVYRSRILLLCDNSFGPFIKRGMEGCGATVDTVESLQRPDKDARYDAILIALRPQVVPVLSAEDAAFIAGHWPGAVVVQFWGDINRTAMMKAGVPVWPMESPAPGHMGILPSAVGPEPIIRLQAGGLKVGEILCRESRERQSHSVSVSSLVRSDYVDLVNMNSDVMKGCNGRI